MDFARRKEMIPMLAVDEDNHVVWRNQWADWLFRMEMSNCAVTDLPGGKALEECAAKARKSSAPILINVRIAGFDFDVEGQFINASIVLIKFHTRYMSRSTMLETHKLMQDFARESGDRVNNPLTTILNSLYVLQKAVSQGNKDKLETYIELAIREAHVMKHFGEWVYRLSQEAPSTQGFDLVSVLSELLERRDFLSALKLRNPIPLVKGNEYNAYQILGGLINLMRQACRDREFVVEVQTQGKGMVIVEINSNTAQVQDLRMLSEEFYGGLGLLAARYLLSLMQAHLEMDYRGNVGIRIAFVLPDPKH